MKRALVFTLLILIYGCNSKCIDFENNFILLNSLELNNEVFADVNFYLYHFVQNETDTLLTFKKDNKIIVYNLKSEKVEFDISLKKLDGLVYRDHLYHNSDSIFLCSILNKHEMYILLMNKDGEIYRRWNINELANMETNGYFYIDSKDAHAMVFIENKLYFQASYSFKPGTVIESQIPIEMVLDLSKGFANQIGDLPIEYRQGIFYGNHQQDYSRVINKKNELVFSFPVSHNIYVYNKSGELLKTVNCKSHYINEIEPIEKDKYNELSAIIDAYTYNAQYSDLIYDKYHNIYYRVVLHKLEKFNDHGKVNDKNKRKWSVMVLDENLRKVKEVLMPGDKFWKRIIITHQGLMLKSISKNNANEYQIFKFQSCIN
jgi:hypothetical protein